MGRSPCCSKIGLNRGAWTASEDKILSDYIKLHGEGKWRHLPVNAGLKRCGKSCRLRWLNYLRPDIKRGNISPDEEDLIIRLHKLLGNRWSLIAGRLPGRTDNEIKNYWNTKLAKKVHCQQLNDDDSVSTQSYEKYEKLKMKMKRTRNSETGSTYRNDLNVVRTKAVRCSKTIFSPHPPTTEPIKSNVVEVKNPTSPKHNESAVSYHHEDDDNPSSNFMVDADMAESGSFLNLFNMDITYPFNLHEQIVKEDGISSTQALTNEMLDHFTWIPEIGGEWLSSL